MDKRILIIDDDALKRLLLVEYIKQCQPKFWVDEADTALKALENIQSIKYDFVFVDYHLPDYLGDYIVKQSKNIWESTKYILNTIDDSVEVDFQELGFDDFLTVCTERSLSKIFSTDEIAV